MSNRKQRQEKKPMAGGRRGGVIACVLDSGSSGPVLSPGWGTTLVSQARHLTFMVPLFTHVYKWVPANLMLRVALLWTSIPSRGEQKYSQSPHASETGISSGLMGHLARTQTLPFYTIKWLVINFRGQVCFSQTSRSHFGPRSYFKNSCSFEQRLLYMS